MPGWIYSAKCFLNWESPKLFYLKSSWYSFPVSQHYCSKHWALHNLAECDPLWKSLCNQMYWDFIIVICHTVRNRLIVLLSVVSCEPHRVSVPFRWEPGLQPVRERGREEKREEEENINSLKSSAASGWRGEQRAPVCGVGTSLHVGGVGWVK